MFSQYLHIVTKYIVLCLVLPVCEAKTNFFEANRYPKATGKYGPGAVMRLPYYRTIGGIALYARSLSIAAYQLNLVYFF